MFIVTVIDETTILTECNDTKIIEHARINKSM